MRSRGKSEKGCARTKSHGKTPQPVCDLLIHDVAPPEKEVTRYQKKKEKDHNTREMTHKESTIPTKSPVEKKKESIILRSVPSFFCFFSTLKCV
jgi:hypothetical protein